MSGICVNHDRRAYDSKEAERVMQEVAEEAAFTVFPKAVEDGLDEDEVDD